MNHSYDNGTPALRLENILRYDSGIGTTTNGDIAHGARIDIIVHHEIMTCIAYMDAKTHIIDTPIKEILLINVTRHDMVRTDRTGVLGVSMGGFLFAIAGYLLYDIPGAIFGGITGAFLGMYLVPRWMRRNTHKGNAYCEVTIQTRNLTLKTFTTPTELGRLNTFFETSFAGKTEFSYAG